MDKKGLEDAESAYGSEVSSNSSFLIKKDTFSIETPIPKSQNRWKWLKYKLREYMVLEAVFFLTLVFLLITCYQISFQNQETQRMVMNIQSQLSPFQKPSGEEFMKRITSQNQEAERMILVIQSQLNSFKKLAEKELKNMKEKTNKVKENESEKTKAMLEEVLKEVQAKSVVQLEARQSIVNGTSNSEETHIPPVIPTVPTNSTLKRFNAASFVAGSRIDTFRSSNSSLSQSFFFDQSSLVLVDRPEPPANKAWCTSDENPVLTVNLAKYINPTAVSYQHSKWNGTIPDDAPNEYSVEACLDIDCLTRKPLFSNCEYNPSGLQEQICNNTSNDSTKSPVGKLQFRFHKNHGNTKRTCVSLIRVYSETEIVPEQKLRRLEDTTECLKLNHRYHQYPKMYKYFTYKNCSILYSKGCCQECPECCDECEINDFNPGVIIRCVLFLVMVICILSMICMIYLAVLESKKGKKGSHRSR